MVYQTGWPDIHVHASTYSSARTWIRMIDRTGSPSSRMKSIWIVTQKCQRFHFHVKLFDKNRNIESEASFCGKNPKKIEKWNPTKMLSESLSIFLWVPRVPMYTFHPRKRRRCLQDLCGDSEFGEMCHGARRFGAIIWSTHYHAAWFRADSQWSDLGQHGAALQHWEPEQMGNCHFYDGRRGVIDL